GTTTGCYELFTQTARKPVSLSRLPGASILRNAERQFRPLPDQEPPRKLRRSPTRRQTRHTPSHTIHCGQGSDLGQQRIHRAFLPSFLSVFCAFSCLLWPFHFVQ